MTIVVIILVGTGCLVAGFLVGVRYCVHSMLPDVLARMSPRERSRVVNEASKIAATLPEATPPEQ